MDDNWQPGDLALCIKQGPWCDEENVITPGPCAGEVHTVDETFTYPVPGWGTMLFFKRWPHVFWLAEGNFVKITPGAESKGIEVDRRRKQPVRV